MGLEKPKNYRDNLEVSQKKQSKAEKNSETSDQRLLRNTRFLKAVGTGLVLGMSRMGGALADQSHLLQSVSGSDNSMALLPPSDQRG